MVKVSSIIAAALLFIILGIASCTPSTQPSPVVFNNQTIKPQSSAVPVDNRTMPVKEYVEVTPDSSNVNKVDLVHVPAQNPAQLLFLRIDPSNSTLNLYGKYDLTSVSRDIWVMDIDGRNAINLTKSTANAMSADWSPDKTKIVFDSVNSYLQGLPVCSINIMDADGSHIKQVSPGASSRHFPAWSPDGNTIANSRYFVTSCAGRPIPCKYFTLFTFSQNGNEDSQITFSSSIGYQVLPRWFPDSKHIAFLDNQTGFYEIWSGDITSDSDLTKYNIESNPTYMPWFSLSPDATKIAYSHDSTRDYYHLGREIFVFNTMTGATTQITNNDYADDNPCFSPDGKQIAFASFGDTKETSGMFTADINGKNLNQISSQYGDMPMEWK